LAFTRRGWEETAVTGWQSSGLKKRQPPESLQPHLTCPIFTKKGGVYREISAKPQRCWRIWQNKETQWLHSTSGISMPRGAMTFPRIWKRLFSGTKYLHKRVMRLLSTTWETSMPKVPAGEPKTGFLLGRGVLRAPREIITKPKWIMVSCCWLELGCRKTERKGFSGWRRQPKTRLLSNCCRSGLRLFVQAHRVPSRKSLAPGGRRATNHSVVEPLAMLGGFGSSRARDLEIRELLCAWLSPGSPLPALAQNAPASPLPSPWHRAPSSRRGWRGALSVNPQSAPA